MRQSKPATQQRTNRAFRIAYLADLQRIHYTITLTAFIHSWAVLVISWLIPSAYTVLEYLAALNRSNTTGYIGIACAYKLLAPRIAAATHRKCAPRTLERGLAALKALGLVELRPWTMPDYTIHRGDHKIVVKGTAKVELPGGRWCSRQLRIVVLTDRALALWDRATKSQGSRFLAQYPTPAKVADNSPLEQIDKSIMLQTQTTNDDKIRSTRDNMLDSEQTQKHRSKRPPSYEKGRSTCPPSSAEPSPPPFEHRTSTPQKPVDQIERATAPRGALRAAPVFKPTATPPKAKGCSRERPTVPRAAPRTWTTARALILREIHKALMLYSTRQANTIFDRAKTELSRNYPAGWTTATDWNYWIGRFPVFTAGQRSYHAKRDIIPLLQNTAPITPDEPRRYREGWRVAELPAPLPPPADDLPAELARLSKKFVED